MDAIVWAEMMGQFVWIQDTSDKYVSGFARPADARFFVTDPKYVISINPGLLEGWQDTGRDPYRKGPWFGEGVLEP